MSTQVPSRVLGGRYRLVAPLGRGGMGTVWAAVDETLGRHVAVKEVTPPPELDDVQRGQLRERTLREARAAARIDSAAAVTVYDVVEEDGRPWIVMQLVQARTLADVIREDGPLSERDVARIGLRVLEALTAAHRAGVLHRDVKPANVLIPEAGEAILSDFGIASLDGDASMTTTGMLIGSPAFMAPERARGVPPSPASDLWSLGATMSTALRGRSPFERDGQIPTLLAVMHDDPAPSPARGPLAQAISGLLRKDPDERLGAHAVHDLLTQAADNAPATTVVAAPPPSGQHLDRTQQIPVLPETAIVTHAAPVASIRPDQQPRPVARPVPVPAPAPAPARTAAAGTTYGDRRGHGIATGVGVSLLAAGAVAAAVLWPRGDAGSSVTIRPPGASASVSPSASSQPSGKPTPRAGVGGSATAATTAPAASASPGGATPTASVAASPSPAATSSTGTGTGTGTGSGAGALPGFTTYTSNSFDVAVPDGWVRSVEGPQTKFKEPGGRRFMLVERGGVPNGDPLADSRYIESQFVKSHGGYTRVRLERVDYKTFNTADWEFTWRASTGLLHVLDRNIVDVRNNRAYAVYWSVPAEDWASNQPALQHVLDSFTPKE